MLSIWMIWAKFKTECTQSIAFDMMRRDVKFELRINWLAAFHLKSSLLSGHLSCDEFHFDSFAGYCGDLQPFQRHQCGAIRCVGWFTSNTIGFGHFKNTICVSADKTHHGNQIPRCKCACFLSHRIDLVTFYVCVPGNWQRQWIRNCTWN